MKKLKFILILFLLVHLFSQLVIASPILRIDLDNTFFIQPVIVGGDKSNRNNNILLGKPILLQKTGAFSEFLGGYIQLKYFHERGFGGFDLSFPCSLNLSTFSNFNDELVFFILQTDEVIYMRMLKFFQNKCSYCDSSGGLR